MNNKVELKCMRCGNTYEMTEESLNGLSYTKRAYCDDCLEIGLQSLRGYKPYKYIKVKDLYAYCNQVVKTIEKVRQKSFENKNPLSVSDVCKADEYFSKELCRWKYDIPNMIKYIQSGEWKKNDEQQQ